MPPVETDSKSAGDAIAFEFHAMELGEVPQAPQAGVGGRCNRLEVPCNGTRGVPKAPQAGVEGRCNRLRVPCNGT
jgi:hypothetical protein